MESDEFILVLASVGAGYAIGDGIGYPVTGMLAGGTIGSYLLNGIKQHKRTVNNNKIQQQKLENLFKELANKYKNNTKTLWSNTTRDKYPSACSPIVQALSKFGVKANIELPSLPTHQKLTSETFGSLPYRQLKESDFIKIDMWSTYVGQIKEVSQRLKDL